MKNQSAKKAYNERIAEAKALLADLTAYVEANGEVETETINWGHVGSLGHVNSQLKEIRSFIRGEEA